MNRLLLILFSVSFALFIFPVKAFADLAINEISPSEEWVELINNGSSEISLEGCILSMGNTGQEVTFSSSDIVAASSYKVAEKGVTIGWDNNWLNNSGDSVSLNCLGNDAVTYGSEVDPKTYGRNPNGNGSFVVLESSTKGSVNSGPVPTPSPEPTNAPTTTNAPTPTKTPTPTKSPTPTSIKTPTPTKKTTPTPTKKLSEKEANSEDLFIAGDTTITLDKSPTPTPKGEVLGSQTSKQPLIYVALGLIFLFVCGILAYFQFGDKILVWKKKNL